MTSLPDGCVIPQYTWMFADILWHPDKIVMDPSEAANLAEADLHVFRLGIEANLPLERLYEDLYKVVTEQLLQVCQDFEELIDDPLRYIGEVSELGLPDHQISVRLDAVAEFEGQHSRLRERTVLHGEYTFIGPGKR